MIDTANIESCVAAYRDFFQKKLGIDEIPDAHVRAEIFDETDASLTKVGGTDLDDLSHLVADAIGPGLAPQKTVFKILYGLYRGGAFSYDPSAAKSHYHPFITGRVIDRSEWDTCFVKNSLRVLSKEKPDWPIADIALAEVLGVGTEQIRDLLDKLWG